MGLIHNRGLKPTNKYILNFSILLFMTLCPLFLAQCAPSHSHYSAQPWCCSPHGREFLSFSTENSPLELWLVVAKGDNELVFKPLLTIQESEKDQTIVKILELHLFRELVRTVLINLSIQDLKYLGTFFGLLIEDNWHFIFSLVGTLQLFLICYAFLQLQNLKAKLHTTPTFLRQQILY